MKSIIIEPWESFLRRVAKCVSYHEGADFDRDALCFSCNLCISCSVFFFTFLKLKSVYSTEDIHVNRGMWNKAVRKSFDYSSFVEVIVIPWLALHVHETCVQYSSACIFVTFSAFMLTGVEVFSQESSSPWKDPPFCCSVIAPISHKAKPDSIPLAFFSETM